MLSFEEFKEFYDVKGYLPDNIYCTRNKRLNEKQLKTKYKKYLKLEVKKQEKFREALEKELNKDIEKEIEKAKDKEWEKVLKDVWIRDKGECQLWSKLTESEKELVRKDIFMNKYLYTLDGAHFLSRARYPNLKYEVSNVYLLYRFFHERLDNMRDPLTNEKINKEKWIYWWKRIINRLKR